MAERAGITIYNDHGTIQIDDRNHNLCVVAQGTGTYNASGVATFTITDPVSPAFAIAGAVAGATHWDRSTNVVSVYGYPGSSFSWFHFDRPRAPFPGVGIEIRNAAGVVMFHSAKKYARVVGFRAGSNWSGAMALPTNRTHAVLWLVGNYAFERESVESPPGWWSYRFRDLSPVVEFTNGQALFSSYPMPWGDWSQPLDTGSEAPMPAQKISLTSTIIDVTGF